MDNYNDIPVVPMDNWGEDIESSEPFIVNGLEQSEPTQQPQEKAKTPFQPSVGDIARGAGDIIQSGYEGAKTALSLGNLGSKAADGIAAAFNPDASYADYRAESEARRYKPKSGVGKLTYTLMKYGTLPADGLRAGMALDTLLYEKNEGHLLNGGKDISWDNKLGDIGDRGLNAIEGLGAGLFFKGITHLISGEEVKTVTQELEPVLKEVSKDAPHVTDKLTKLFSSTSHEEVKTLTQELEPVLKEVEVKATVEDIVDQVGNNRVDVFKAAQELPYEDGMRALKEFDAQEEAKLLDTNPSDSKVLTGKVELNIIDKTGHIPGTVSDKATLGTASIDKFSGQMGVSLGEPTEIMSRNGVDEKGVQFWMQKIQDGERPTILLDKEGKTVLVRDGNHRLEAYKRLGFGEVPIIDNTGGKLPENLVTKTSQNIVKEPYQMTKDEFRQSLAGDEQRVFQDAEGNITSKMNGKIADRRLDETLDEVWNDRGLSQADNEKDKEWLQRVVNTYKDKWGNSDVNVKVGLRDLGNKAGYVSKAEDGTVNLVVNKNNMYQKAALRHELEHLHDVVSNKVPTDGTHFSRYGNEDTFAADYVHKKNITKAVKEGKALPESVSKEYANVIPNLDQAVKEVPSAPAQLKLDFNASPEAQAFHSEVKATGEVTDTAIQTLNKSEDVQGIYSTLATASEKHNPFAKETAEEFITNSKAFFKDMYEGMNPNHSFDEWFNTANMSQEQIRSARFLLGNLRKIQQGTNEELLNLGKVFMDSPEGAAKARLMDSLSALQTKATKIDTAIRGSFSEAGRLLQSAQRPSEVIDQISLYDNYVDTIIKKDLLDKGLDVQFFDSVVKEATDSIEKLFAQGQGQMVTADHIEALLTKAFGGDLALVGADSKWLRNEALRILEDYKPGDDLKSLVRSSVRNTINFSQQLDDVKGFIASSAAPDFWGQVKKKGWNNASGYFIQNLLSGVPTAIKNTLGGVSKTYFDNAARRLAGTREERELAALEFECLARNFKRSLELSKSVFKNEPIFGRAGQYVETMGNLPQHLLDSNKLPVAGSRDSWDLPEGFKPNSAQETFLKVSETLGQVSHDLSRWLPMTDEFLTSWNYYAKVESQAIMDSRKYLQQSTKGKYTLEQVRELSDKELNSAKYFNLDTGHPTDVDMLRESREASLVNPLTQEESNSTLLYGAADAIQKLKAKQPVVKFFVPFVNALARLGQNTIDTLPGSRFIPGISTYDNEIKAGGRRAALAQGKVAMGQYVIGSAFIAGCTGMFTGSAPLDKAASAALKKRGWKPYSVVFNDGSKSHYISYKDLEPFASLVGIGVDLSQNIQHLGEEDITSILAKTSYSLKSNILDKTFFSSLSNQADLFSPDKWTDHTGQTLGGLVAAGVIPGSSFFSHLGNVALGDTMKEPRDFAQNILSRIPLINQTLPDKLNDLGEPIQVPLAKRVTGIGYSVSENNIVNNELTDLAEKGLKLPAPKTDKNGVQFENYFNKDGISAYEAIHRGKATTTLGGKTMRQALNDLISSSFYQSLPTGEEVEKDGLTLDYSDKYTRIGQVKRVYQQYLDSSINDVMWNQEFTSKQGSSLKQDYTTVKMNKIPNLQGAFGD